MPNSLAPAFVKIEYASTNAPHVMIIPTLPYNPAAISGDPGTFDTWDSAGVAADDMVNDLVDALKLFFTSGLTFVNYTIFTQVDAVSLPVPRFSDVLAQVGTHTGTTWQKAVQVTMTARTTLFGIARLDMLDAVSENNFDAIVTLPGSGDVLTLFTVWTNTGAGWAGRDNGRPGTFIKVTKTLNEKLRRSYHMT